MLGEDVLLILYSIFLAGINISSSRGAKSMHTDRWLLRTKALKYFKFDQSTHENGSFCTHKTDMSVIV